MAYVTKDEWTLYHADGEPVEVGEVVLSFRGEKLTVLSGTPPHHPGSTGHVYVQSEEGWRQEFYPSVIGARWAPDKGD